MYYKNKLKKVTLLACTAGVLLAGKCTKDESNEIPVAEEIPDTQNSALIEDLDKSDKRELEGQVINPVAKQAISSTDNVSSQKPGPEEEVTKKNETVTQNISSTLRLQRPLLR